MDYNISTGKDGKRSFVSIYFEGKRYRLFNGKSIGLPLKASDNLELLRSAYELKLMEGWRPKKIKTKEEESTEQSFTDKLRIQSELVQTGRYSYHHKRDCRWVVKEWGKYAILNNTINVKMSEIKIHQIEAFIKQSKWSNRTQKNVLTTLKCISNQPLKERLNRIKIRRTKSTLHKPIKEVEKLLKDLKRHNHNLYLCCLITYGCLLRPHQEIRLLKWSDIDLNKGFISLSGDRNKSGRNRIVPIPNYVKEELLKIEPESSGYLFSNNGNAFSRDYFSILWKRYKAKTEKDLRGITLYSWRHTGAIKVFEKTGSLQKLQQVMGHSDMKVSLTYLRGLEIRQLDVEDLPDL